MTVPYLAQREDQQQLEWIGGSVFSVLLDAEATGGQLTVGRFDVSLGEAPPFHASLDLREAIAAAVAADGLVVATPVVATSPSDVFESFFAVLDDCVLSGVPVLLAVNSGSRWQPPDIEQVMRGRLTCLHAEPVPTVVVAGPADWEESPSGATTRLREHIDQAAAELAAAMSSHRR